jgi:hypothetical protein
VPFSGIWFAQHRKLKPAAGHLAKAGVEAGEILRIPRDGRRRGKYAAGTVVPAADVFVVSARWWTCRVLSKGLPAPSSVTK